MSYICDETNRSKFDILLYALTKVALAVRFSQCCDDKLRRLLRLFVCASTTSSTALYCAREVGFLGHRVSTPYTVQECPLPVLVCRCTGTTAPFYPATASSQDFTNSIISPHQRALYAGRSGRCFFATGVMYRTPLCCAG